MKVIFTNPSTIQPPHRRAEKSSTTQLKQALEKIKQTQLQVLKVLRSETETSNLTPTQMKVITQNIASITKADLLKIAEANKVKRQFEREKKAITQKLNSVSQKNQQLEHQLNKRRQMESQWSNERRTLIDRLHFYSQQNHQQTKIIKSDQAIKGMVLNYQEELNQKVKQRVFMENELQQLQVNLKKQIKDKENLKTKCDQLTRQISQRQKIFIHQLKKSQSRLKNTLPFDDIILQIKKITNNHQKIFNGLKTRTRIAIEDLDVQEQIQQSFAKILRYIDFSQKTIQSQSKQSDSKEIMIKLGKFPDYSFANQSKKMEIQDRKAHNQMIQSQVMNQSITNLKQQNLKLKQNKIQLQNSIKTLETKLTELQNELAKSNEIAPVLQLKQYNDLVDQLKKQMLKIRQQKQALSTLVKKIGENSIKSASQQNGLKVLREQLDQIIAINVELRKQNQNLKVLTDGLKHQIQTLKFQERKYEQNLLQKHILIQKQVKQKGYLIQQLKKYEKMSQQKDGTCSKHEAKIGEMNEVIQGNYARYQHDLKFKMQEVNSLRQQIQRHMQELRDLRELAYEYKILQKQNDVLKKKIMQVNATVIHLWQVKQTEYSNIDKVLQSARK